MKIAYIQKSSDEQEYIRSNLDKETDISFFKRLTDIPPDLSKEVEIISIFFKGKIGKEELERFPSLKMIAIRSTGFDNIDTEICKERGIVVSNVPNYGENTVAEHTFALILALSRKICLAHEQVSKTGTFTRENLRGFDLYEKTLGVIGTGRIGMNVIKIAKGFNMKILAYDPFPKPEMAEILGFQYQEFNSVLKESDILTLHAPQNQYTYHMINNDNIERIKRGSFLINVARGGLIETEALIKALKEGIVEGAGLDVLEEEDLVGKEKSLNIDSVPKLQTLLWDQYLINHPKVLITPHNAFNTKEAFVRIQDTTIENIKRFMAGDPINKIQ